MNTETLFPTVMKMLMMIIRIHLKSKCVKLPKNMPLILIHFRLCPVPAKIAGTTSTALWRSFPNCQRVYGLMLVLLFLPLG